MRDVPTSAIDELLEECRAGLERVEAGGPDRHVVVVCDEGYASRGCGCT